MRRQSGLALALAALALTCQPSWGQYPYPYPGYPSRPYAAPQWTMGRPAYPMSPWGYPAARPYPTYYPAMAPSMVPPMAPVPTYTPAPPVPYAPAPPVPYAPPPPPVVAQAEPVARPPLGPASSVSYSSKACCEPCPPPCPVEEPCDIFCRRRGKVPLFYFFSDYLYLKPRGADVAYGQPRDGVTPTAVPRGPIGVVDPEYASGFRAGLGFGIAPHSAVLASFTWYSTSGSDTIGVAGVPLGIAIHSLLTFPATSNTAADSQVASATTDIDYRYYDLDFKHKLLCGPHYNLYLLLGGRYATLEQDLTSEFSILGKTTVTSNIDFKGGGVRAGLDGDFFLRWGFFSYGRGSASLLGGRFAASYEQRHFLSGEQARTSYTDHRVVPILELEVGLGWSCWQGRFRISGGYSVSGWFNTLTTPTWIQGVQNSNFTTNTDNLRDTLTFDGLTARVEFRY